MCIAGEDIWHLDCERAREAAGIRTGEPHVSVNQGCKNQNITCYLGNI